jgi:hypothetical protein
MTHKATANLADASPTPRAVAPGEAFAHAHRPDQPLLPVQMVADGREPTVGADGG